MIGAGSWGTALAALLCGKRERVTLWCRELEIAESVNTQHRNALYVSELELPQNLVADTDLARVAATHRVLVMVVPTQFTRAVVEAMRPHLRDDAVLVSASKGIEVQKIETLAEIYDEMLPEAMAQRACFLSGPSFAREVIRGLPAAVAIACRDAAVLPAIQELFFFPHFRTYRTDDVVGVELGGALKNVIAIAAGICDGLQYGHSARAALLTRGLAEIARLGIAMGGKAETFAGLSGMGDLLLTATSTQSRNYTVGHRLGSGETLEQIQAGAREVAEGVKTADAAYRLAQQKGVEMPIVGAVYAILYEQRNAREVVLELLSREMKPEVTG
ncbi:putative glycerol-3-phosphate dehydrogenase (NAD(P)(+)) [Magnetofaba australis IT-1]|uniref:Glycerol-3-phosphate dehydrogenase [NAD(P)+] n=1 Tax=Magnetofaba australis IT-1 TaxID=1434232 RepID=A0A1Y2K8K0_9PROT|nr:putative glycerol-3-phosphate dehydrogenase (NAD(P)(+)) [Magnetofaba australis IT-1]